MDEMLTAEEYLAALLDWQRHSESIAQGDKLTNEEYLAALLDWKNSTTRVIGGENVPPSNEADTVVMLEDSQ